MDDQIIQASATPAPAADPAPSAAPVAAAPVQDSNSPQGASGVPSADSKAAELPAPASDKIPETLLSPDKPPPAAQPVAEAKPNELKSTEGEKPTEVKKDEASKSAEPAPLPTYEPWTLPEGVKLDEKMSGEFNSLLGEFQNTAKAEQAAVQKFGQDLIDKHLSLMGDELKRVHESYQDAWMKQTEGWKEDFVKDPEIGGNRQETSVRAANEFITTHGGTPEQQAEFRKLMGTTGIGNHPAMIRMFANAMTKFSESKQPAPMHFPTAKLSRTQRMYGKKTG